MKLKPLDMVMLISIALILGFVLFNALVGA